MTSTFQGLQKGGSSGDYEVQENLQGFQSPSRKQVEFLEIQQNHVVAVKKMKSGRNLKPSDVSTGSLTMRKMDNWRRNDDGT